MTHRSAGAIVAVACVLSAPSTSRAQEEPFEPEPLVAARPALPEVSGFDPFAPAALAAIGAYQTHVGPRSISRCPFRISCSRFAVEHIRRHGLLVGLAYFADRFLYRENEAVLRHYGRAVGDDGALKLDDSIPDER